MSNGSRLILIDDAQLAGRLPRDLPVWPFLERGGQYWGLPADSATAIAELERLRERGAGIHCALSGRHFGGLDYYAEFCRHLRERYREVVSNERLVIFELKK